MGTLEIIWIISGIICAIIGETIGVPFAGILVGALLGPLGVLVMIAAANERKGK